MVIRTPIANDKYKVKESLGSTKPKWGLQGPKNFSVK